MKDSRINITPSMEFGLFLDVRYLVSVGGNKVIQLHVWFQGGPKVNFEATLRPRMCDLLIVVARLDCLLVISTAEKCRFEGKKI